MDILKEDCFRNLYYKNIIFYGVEENEPPYDPSCEVDDVHMRTVSEISLEMGEDLPSGDMEPPYVLNYRPYEDVHMRTVSEISLEMGEDLPSGDIWPPYVLNYRPYEDVHMRTVSEISLEMGEDLPSEDIWPPYVLNYRPYEDVHMDTLSDISSQLSYHQHENDVNRRAASEIGVEMSSRSETLSAKMPRGGKAARFFRRLFKASFFCVCVCGIE